MSRGLVIVFARAPVAGYAKKRLIPVLGADGAADLHRRLVLHTLSTAVSTGIPVELWCAPDRFHTFFAACTHDYPVTLKNQAGEDLGERMYNAFTDTLSRTPASVIIGCDSPALTPQMITDAFYSLENGNDAVIGPAEDGGYFLIGLSF
jgi:rSAM/selenodomain-associated transferase 1